MPCYYQRRFDNPVKPENRVGFDKYTIYGSCNNCAGCAKRKQQDWLVRSYYEYMSDDYDCFFVTLDFDENHLPLYNNIPCFDSDLFSRFTETLRQIVPPFRYLCSCHYGEARHRPHYHVAFLFQKGSYSSDRFWQDLPRAWHYGSHQDISLLRSVKGNPLAAFEYICRYTTYSYKVKSTFKELPYKNRPHTTASIGFGCQCLDPNEISCKRMIEQGVKFNEVPTVTRKYLLENSLLYLDIKNDGQLVPFAIPRFYEYKLMFDSSYDSITKRTTLTKNDSGRELQVIRHNSHYVTLFNEFLNSRSLPIHNDEFVSSIYKEVFPDSPYNGVMWKDVVSDVCGDSPFGTEEFYEFCKYYSWLKFDTSLPGYYRYRPLRMSMSSKEQVNSAYSILRCKPYTLKGQHFMSAQLDGHFDDVFGDDIDLYIYAMSYYQIWKDVERCRKGEYEDWKIQEGVKKKILEKCKNDLSFYWHLRRHNFKFYTLKPKAYVSRYHAKKDYFQE